MLRVLLASLCPGAPGVTLQAGETIPTGRISDGCGYQYAGVPYTLNPQLQRVLGIRRTSGSGTDTMQSRLSVNETSVFGSWEKGTKGGGLGLSGLYRISMDQSMQASGWDGNKQSGRLLSSFTNLKAF